MSELYEPLHPAQAQVAITESITGVQIDLEHCLICGAVRGVGLHHVIYKSRGGEKGPVVPLCLTCHEKEHAHDWRLELEQDGIYLYDREGQVVWRLQRWPLAGEPGEFVQLLDRVTQATKLMPEIAPALLPWQAAEVFRALKEVGEGGWRGQCRLAGELFAWRMPNMTGPEKVEALCSLFGIRRSQCYNALQVADAFAESNALD